MEATAINRISDAASAGAASTASTSPGISSLSSDDFFKLLVTQLTNQDPLQPTSNDEMLRQISSIREIELSSTLTDSLRKITGEQRGSTASSLIGQHVTGNPSQDGSVPQGIVVGVRLAADGPVLVLANGAQLPLDQVALIQSPDQAAASLVGQTVTGVDRRDPRNPIVLTGVVTAARTDDQKRMILELDTGKSLPLSDVAAASVDAGAEVGSG